MRLYSNPQSVELNEISALAIVETLLACSVAIWAAIESRFSLVGVALMSSPFLLLRTGVSAMDGIRIFESGIERMERLIERVPMRSGLLVSYFIGAIVLLLSLIGGVLLVLFSKVFATLRCFALSPLASLSAVPKNWVRICLCIDSAYPPEIMPGVESHHLPYRFVHYWEAVREEGSFLGRVWLGFCLVCFYAPALVYRLCLKSTALVWAPLLWIVPKGNESGSLTTRLRLICESSWGRFVALWSAAVVVLFVLKMALLTSQSASAFLSILHEWPLIHDIIQPLVVPWWQLMGLVNCAIAIGAYFVADHYLIVIEEERYTNSCVERNSLDVCLRVTAVVRSLISCYTISCLAYIFVSTSVPLAMWPRLGESFFPWS